MSLKNSMNYRRVSVNLSLAKIKDASASELRQELLELGGNPDGKSVAELEDAIARLIWERDFPGKEFPAQYSPMLAKEVTSKGSDYIKKNFSEKDFIIQKKENGMRLICAIQKSGEVNFTSRSKSVHTKRFSELDDRILSFQGFKNPFTGLTVLDGEVIMENPSIDTGTTITSSTLQSTVALMQMSVESSLALQKKYGSLTYHVYDILFLNGENVQDKPYAERLDLYNVAIKLIKDKNPGITVKPVKTITNWEDAWETFREAIGSGWEGIMLKSRNGKYEQGKRSTGLLKVKSFVDVDGFVTGFIPSSKGKSLENYIGGLVISAYIDGYEREIAAISNLDLKTRADATVLENGEPKLNPDYYGRCVSIVGQDWNRKSMRLNSARISEWRPDKTPIECQLNSKELRYQDR